jgi:hypothetical protein
MRYFFIIILSFLTLSSDAQLKDLFNMEEVPEMNGVKQWIEKNIYPILYYNLTHSTAGYSDNKFLQFSLVGDTNYVSISFVNSGVEARFRLKKPVFKKMKTDRLGVNYENNISNYNVDFRADKFNFTYEEYFYLANKVLKLDDRLVVANTLNRMIDDFNSKIPREQQLIADINKKTRLNIPTEYKGYIVDHVVSYIRKDSTYTVPQVIYITYIKNKKDKQTLSNLNYYFAGLMTGKPIDQVDEYINPKVIIQPVNKEQLVIPPHILRTIVSDTTITGRDTLAVLNFYTATATLKYREQMLEINFEGDCNYPVRIIKGKKEKFILETREHKWDKISSKEAQYKNFTSFTLQITPKKMSIIAEERSGKYLIYSNKINLKRLLK